MMRFMNVPLSSIHPDPKQPRGSAHRANIPSLAANIEKEGLLSPLVCIEEKEGYRIVAGERRYHALKLLGWESAPILIREKLNVPVPVRDDTLKLDEINTPGYQEILASLIEDIEFKEISKPELLHSLKTQQKNLLKAIQSLKAEVAAGKTPLPSIQVYPNVKVGKYEILQAEDNGSEIAYCVARDLKLDEVKVEVHDFKTEASTLLSQLSENLQREAMADMDISKALQVLVRDMGLSQKDVAVNLGMSETEVSRRLSILSKSDTIKVLVAKELLSYSLVDSFDKLPPQKQLQYSLQAQSSKTRITLAVIEDDLKQIPKRQSAVSINTSDHREAPVFNTEIKKADIKLPDAKFSEAIKNFKSQNTGKKFDTTATENLKKNINRTYPINISLKDQQSIINLIALFNSCDIPLQATLSLNLEVSECEKLYKKLEVEKGRVEDYARELVPSLKAKVEAMGVDYLNQAKNVTGGTTDEDEVVW